MPDSSSQPSKRRPRLGQMLLSAAVVAVIAWFGFPRLQRLEARRRAERAYGRLLGCMCGPELDCRQQTVRARWRALASVRSDERQWPRRCADPAAALVAALRLQAQAGGCVGERCEALQAQAVKVKDALSPADELHAVPLGALMDAAGEAELQLTAEAAPLVLPRPQPLLRSEPRWALSERLTRPPQVRRGARGVSLLMSGAKEVRWCRLQLDEAAAHCTRHTLAPEGRALLDESGRCLLLHDAGRLRLLREAAADVPGHDNKRAPRDEKKQAARGEGKQGPGRTAEQLIELGEALAGARLETALCSDEALWVRAARSGGQLVMRLLPKRGEPMATKGALPLLSAHGIIAAAEGGGIELLAPSGEQLWALPMSAAQIDRVAACPGESTLVLGGGGSGHTTAVAVVSQPQQRGAPAVASTSVSSARYGIRCTGEGVTLSWVDGASERRLAAARNPNGRALNGRYLTKQQACAGGRCTAGEQMFVLDRQSASSHHLIAPLGEGMLALWLSPLGDVRSLLQQSAGQGASWPLLKHEAADGFAWDGAMVQLHSTSEHGLLLLTDKEQRLHALVLRADVDQGVHHVRARYVRPAAAD